MNSEEKRVEKLFTISCIALIFCVSANSVFAQKKSYPGSGMYVAEIARTGTTFQSLAEKYYKNSVFWVYIYLANKDDIPSPNALRSGLSVVIPQASALGIDANNPASRERAEAKIKELGMSYDKSENYAKGTNSDAYANTASNSKSLIVTAKPGDTFRMLALKYYGSKEFWAYIYLANKSKIPHPNKLNVGMDVVIPPAEEFGIDANNPSSIDKARNLGRKVMAENG